jgi:hypothetical protein
MKMEKYDLNVLLKRYEVWELGMLIHLHLKKAEATSVPGIKETEMQQAKLFHDVLKAKIEEVETL